MFDDAVRQLRVVVKQPFDGVFLGVLRREAKLHRFHECLDVLVESGWSCCYPTAFSEFSRLKRPHHRAR